MEVLTVRNDFTAYEAALLCCALDIEPRRAAKRGFLAFEYGWTVGLVTDQMDRAEAQYARDSHVAHDFAERARQMLNAESEGLFRAELKEDVASGAISDDEANRLYGESFGD